MKGEKQMIRFLIRKIKKYKQKKKSQQFWKTVDRWQTEMYIAKLNQERELEKLQNNDNF